MLTSRTAAKHREKAKALGAKGYMVKPYKDEEFIDLIRSLT
jgi:chemosensory pili system protein ChpA (sensor histidine kinase/response regulator)